MKKTVVLGASPNIERYSNMAVRRLKKHGFEAIPVGIKSGEIDGLTIQKPGEVFEDVEIRLRCI